MTNQCREERQDDQLAATARDHGASLTVEQLAAVQDFVDQLGGIENARRIITALNEQQAAA